jgi:macrophage erythroblast attacher
MSSNEFSFLRAPYEEFSSSFKCTKSRIEKELNFCLSHLKTMKNNESNLDRAQSLASISGLRTRLFLFKEKLLDIYHEEDVLLSNLSSRIESLSSPELTKLRLIRLIVDHYDRQDRFDISSSLLSKYPSLPACDTSFFRQALHIRSALSAKDLTPALDWCTLHHSRLSKLSSPLPFKLHLQRFVELIKSQNFCGAILYARSHLSKFPENQPEIQKAMMLLLISNKPSGFSEYADFTSDARWTDLIALFTAEMLRVYSLPSESYLAIVLRAGLIALKSPLCEREARKGCPVCSRDVQVLARGVPHACQSHTFLICRVLNVVMDEHNPPLALPNGQTFSEQALKQITKDGKIVCPVTGAVFNARQVSRLFIV